MKVSRYEKNWDHNVVEHLQSVHPFIDTANSTIAVNFIGKDVEKGAAAGTLSINDRVFIPVVIKSFEIKPLEMFTDKQGDAYPLTETTYTRAVSDGDYGTLDTNDRPRRSARSNEMLYHDLQYSMQDTGGYGLAPYADSGEVDRKLNLQYKDVDQSNEILMAALQRYYNAPLNKEATAPKVSGVDATYVTVDHRFNLYGMYTPYKDNVLVKTAGATKHVLVHGSSMSLPFKVLAKMADGYWVDSNRGKIRIKLSADISGIEFGEDTIHIGPDVYVLGLDEGPWTRKDNVISKTADGYMYNGMHTTAEGLYTKLAEEYAPGTIYLALGMMEASGTANIPVPTKHREVSNFDLMKAASVTKAYAAPVYAGVVFDKIAIDDREAFDTVDTLLGLNFASTSMLKSFINRMGILMKAKNVLGKMFVYSLLTEAFDSDTVLNALHAVQSVIDELTAAQ